MSELASESISTASDAGDVLRIAGLTVRFGGVVAVNDVSLSLRPGLLYGLVGPNGSGKSTLLGAISRLTRSSGGRIYLGGTEISTLAPHTVFQLGLSRTFQTVRLLPTLSVLENVMVGCDSDAAESGTRSGLRSLFSAQVEATARKSAIAALSLLGLAELTDARPTALSYGMQRRVEIARALVSDPKLLLYDEPTAGMAQSERADISRVLRELRASGHTQLIVDHDVDMMVGICDHLFVMNYGALIANGAPAEVIALPVVQEAYLGKR